MIIMVVATHPDDEVLGCGGVMAKHSAAGDEVHVLVVTRGSEEIYPKVEIEATRLEMKQAHAILGVRSTTFLDFPAPKLDTIPQHQIVDTISKEIKRLQPEVIYLPHRGDIHGDHRAVYHAVLVAARPQTGSPVRKLLSYETLSETEWAPPVPDEGFIPDRVRGYLEVSGEEVGSIRMLQKPDEGIPTPTIIECNKSACPPAWQHGQSGSSRGIHAGKGDRSVNPKNDWQSLCKPDDLSSTTDYTDGTDLKVSLQNCSWNN